MAGEEPGVHFYTEAPPQVLVYGVRKPGLGELCGGRGHRTRGVRVTRMLLALVILAIDRKSLSRQSTFLTPTLNRDTSDNWVLSSFLRQTEEYCCVSCLPYVLPARPSVATVFDACCDRGAPSFFWGSSTWEIKTAPKTDLEKIKTSTPDEKCHGPEICNGNHSKIELYFRRIWV